MLPGTPPSLLFLLLLQSSDSDAMGSVASGVFAFCAEKSVAIKHMNKASSGCRNAGGNVPLTLATTAATNSYQY